MGNIVRHISNEEVNRLVSPHDFSRPSGKEFDKKEKRSFNKDNSQDLPVKQNPYRANFLGIIDPALIQLRASKLPPEEREAFNRGLMELLLYWAENRLKN